MLPLSPEQIDNEVCVIINALENMVNKGIISTTDKKFISTKTKAWAYDREKEFEKFTDKLCNAPKFTSHICPNVNDNYGPQVVKIGEKCPFCGVSAKEDEP